MNDDLKEKLGDFLSGIKQAVDRRANNSTKPIAHLARGVLDAEAEQILLNDLNKMRQMNPDLFIRTVFKIARKIGGVEGNRFINQLKLTPVEFASLTVEMAQDRGQTVAELVGMSVEDYAREIGLTVETAKGPTGEELLVEAFRQISAEKPDWKAITREEVEQIHRDIEDAAWHVEPEPSVEELFEFFFQALRKEKPEWRNKRCSDFTTKLVEKNFTKNPKPYKAEDVKVAVTWYEERRKIITEEKKRIIPYYDSRPQVGMGEWKVFFKTRFGTETPVFAKQFKKDVSNFRTQQGIAKRREI